MCYVGAIFLIHPLLILILVSVLFAVSFSVIYLMKRIMRLTKEEIANEKGSLRPLVVAAWWFNVGSLAASLIIMDIVSFTNPYLNKIHDEWGLAHSNAYVPAVVYIALLALLHAALLSFSYFFFKKHIVNKSKRIIMLIVLVVVSALIWAVLTGFALGVYSGI